jgi:PTS system fructose-specific IIC component
MAAKSVDEFLDVIDKKETERYPEDTKEEGGIMANEGKFVVAVTACPTGIAHTYMAAESLDKKAKEMGLTLKCETNGSGGAKNVLTDDDIAKADGVIIAADITINLARFDGKKVLQCKVADGIHKPEELINKVLSDEVPVYKHKGEKSSESSAKKSGGGVYGHLMNGVSHMLPFVVAGGIFIAIAFLIDTACGVNAAEVGGSFGTVTPVANWFKTLGNVAFSLMVPILAGYIAQSIADRPGLLVGLVGGFMATSGATFFDPAAASVTPSGFLGGLFAGFVGGYMMLAIEKMCDKFPKALEGIKPVLVYPLLGLGGILVLMCAVNPIMGLINSAMSNALTAMNESGLLIPLCALLAGMMAIDMGGPFNKAAYSFATIFLAEGTDAAYVIMAAVMIGGMVPPLAIALSNTFFKNRWTDDERKNAPVNYVMGLSFITEGAIPYAASYPLKVIPSCIVGSAVAGTLSALFGCKLMAPHGGIFVFATMAGTWYMYLLALAIGAVVGMLMLALLKRPINK